MNETIKSLLEKSAFNQIQEQILVSLLKEYAKVCCEKQRLICATKARTKLVRPQPESEEFIEIIDIDTILNSPYPEELR